MAIDRTGISSLNAGAGDITYTGNQGPKSPDQQLMAQADPMIVEMYQQYVFEMEEQGMQPVSFKQFLQQIMSESRMSQGESANPTYSQRRKQRMAYGGIAGVDGRKRYGIGSWFQKAKDKIVDDIIPNEIKAIAKSPIGKAALMYAGGAGLSSLAAGQGMGSLAQLGTYNPMNVMSNIGTGIGRGITGAKNLLGIDQAIDDSLKMNIVPEGVEDIVKGGSPYQNIFETGAVGQTPGALSGMTGMIDPYKNIFETGAVGHTPGNWQPADVYKNIFETGAISAPKPSAAEEPGFWTKLGQTLMPGGEKGFGNLYGTLFGPSTYGEGENAQTINWKTPLAIGMSMGALDKATRKDESLPAQPGIDIADISSRALTGSDPDLRFLPPASATTAYAQGGRIGYAGGGTWGIDTAREEWNKLGINSKLGYEDFVDFFLNGPWGSNQYRTGSDKLAQGGRV
jgi:hypothetical protein